MKIIRIEETDSTNEYLKREDDGKDKAVIALRQTSGRGTKGRSFVSEDGGLYFSVMRRYNGFPVADAFKILVNACVAVCVTLEKFGFMPVIRWANDVLVDGKKISGTLIENTVSNGNIVRSIVGTGINVNNSLPDELCGVATGMRELTGRDYDLKAVSDELLKNFGKEYSVDDYRRYINWFGKAVILKTSDCEKCVTALNVTDDGRLLVDDGGKILKISSAEVSLRL